MLVRPANFLLMDEPTNHLDISSREILTDALDAYRGTLCFITHDRTLIREIANKIIEIRNGEPLVYNGITTNSAPGRNPAEQGPERQLGLRKPSLRAFTAGNREAAQSSRRSCATVISGRVRR
jgi:ABC-type multidrug transport system ATPase subunit